MGVFVKMYQFWILSSPPPFAYSYWVVFSLNIQIDWQSKQVFLQAFCKDEVSTPFGVCVCLCKRT